MRLQELYEKHQENSASIQSAVYETLKEAIITHDITPEITENMISSDLGISRTPVREAMKKLSSSGYLEITHGKNAKVVFATKQDIKEICEALRALYIASTEMCIQKASDEELSQLEELCELIKLYVKRKDIDQIIDYTSKFHLKVCELGQNKWLYKCIVNLNDFIYNNTRNVLSNPTRLNEMYTDHYTIYQLIKARDLEHMPEVIKRHVRNDSPME
ncbi:MAG: GntR family transcriptional regulator [bacterium]|nr:GntR family transcriptional regulator [bacterium]